MSLELVKGQWQPHQAAYPPQGSAVAPAPQPVSLRPVSSSPSEDYAWRCREVLSHRARRALALCFAPVAFTTWLVKLFGIASFLDPVLFALRAVAFALVVSAALLPILVLRGRRRTTRRADARTKLRQYTALVLDRQPRETLAAYATSAVALSGLLALQCGADAPWKFALAGTGRNVWQFNEAFIFHNLVLLGFVGLTAGRHSLQQRNVVVFPEQPTLLASRFTAALLRAVPSALSYAGGTYLLSVAAFGVHTIVRKPLIRFLMHYTPLIAPFRGHLHALYRGGGIGFGSFTFIAFELFAIAILWEHVNVLADIYFSQYMLLSGSASNPAKSLLDGLQHRDPFVRHFAYQELSLIAQADPARRIAIYKDIRSAPNGFARVSRECLVLLGRSYRTVQGRGDPTTPVGISSADASPAAGPTEGGAQPVVERATVQRESAIFRPTRKTFFDKLSLSGAAAAAPPAPSQPAAAAGSGQTQQGPPPLVPEVLRSKSKPSTSAPQASAPPARTSAPAPYNPLVAAESYLVKAVPRLFGPLPASRVSACLPDPKLNIWACEALSHLVTASLQEDDFGVVQQELPKILEAFVTYLRALEALIDELNQAGPDAQAAVLEVVAPVNSALQTGLSRMVDVLGPHLGAFRFPPAVAKRLQLAVDWGARQREEQ